MVSTVKFLKGERVRVVTDTPLHGLEFTVSDVSLESSDGKPRQQAKYVVHSHKYDTTLSFYEWELEDAHRV